MLLPERAPKIDSQMREGRATSPRTGFHLAVEKLFRTATSVSVYAKRLQVSADHLSAVIREQTGWRPGDIIRERVRLQAKRLTPAIAFI